MGQWHRTRPLEHARPMPIAGIVRPPVFVSIVALVILALVGAHAAAQASVAAPPDATDPPARVGRLALIDGVVSFRPAVGDSWAVAIPNRVITTGDRLWVDSMGRAEVEVGPNAVRIASETELDVVHLDDDLIQLRVPQGTANVHLKSVHIGDVYEADAPNAAITLTESGEYRFDVSANGDTTRVTVWSGHAEVTAAGSTFEVNARQLATVVGDSAPVYDLADAGEPDAFDRWALSRDDRMDRATVSTRYVSTEVAGTEDLDEYGHWVDEPDYGPMWFPTTVVVGWAPCRFGYWNWVDPWGWSWIDEAPWGWGPFHYGRWAFIGGAWGWWPGPLLVSMSMGMYWPVYGPGLVEFIGGPDWGVDYFGIGGGIGWFPLGPREPYRPPYHVGPIYRRRIDGAPRNGPSLPSYRNRAVAGAVTSVSGRAFAVGELVSRVAVTVPESELAAARVADGGAPVVPTPASLVGGGKGRTATSPPARLSSRPVVALHAPPPGPVPFRAEQPKLAANGGRPLTATERSVLRPTTAPDGSIGQTIRSAAVRAPQGAELRPGRPGLPAARSALGPASARRVGVGQSPLEDSYGAEHSELNARHMREFAQPARAEPPQALSERQEIERRELQSRYQAARQGGMTHMPTPVAPRGGGRPR